MRGLSGLKCKTEDVMLNRILIGIIIALMFSTGYYYVCSSLKTKTINEQIAVINEMNTEINVLNNNLFSCKLTCDAEREAIKYIEQENERLKETELSTLKGLQDALQKDKPLNLDTSSRLPDDVRRLLNNHCDKVAGQPCKSP